MAIYATKSLKEQVLLDEEFINDINSDKLNIVFESAIINEEYRLNNIKNNQLFLYIRTWRSTGAYHDCTTKLINGTKYKHGNDLGLPFKVEETDPHFYVWFGDSKQAQNLAKQESKRLTTEEKKFVKKVINENYEDILIYWDLDLNNPKDIKIANEIELKIYNKYRS